MKTKRKKTGQPLLTGIGTMLAVGLVSCSSTAVLLQSEIVPYDMGEVFCWIITAVGAYAVSWYTAKRSEKNKMQMAVAVIGVYLCIALAVGRLLFSASELRFSVWVVILMAAAVLGGITSCVKKERKR